MPKATVSGGTERFDLKSLPEGYVVLKRMSYGQMLERQEMSASVLMDTDKKGQSMAAKMQFVQRAVAQFEMRNCVVDHNLTDDDEQLLNFNRPDILAILDPRVGTEIGELIDKMNQFEEEPGNLSVAPVPA